MCEYPRFSFKEWFTNIAQQRAENCHIVDLMTKFDHQEKLADAATKWRNNNWNDFKDVTAPPPPPQNPPPLFYLRALDLSYKWLYLTVFQQAQLPSVYLRIPRLSLT